MQNEQIKSVLDDLGSISHVYSRELEAGTLTDKDLDDIKYLIGLAASKFNSHFDKWPFVDGK